MDHKCPITNCAVRVAPDKLMCPGHWSLVPKDLGDALYRSYRTDAKGTLHMAAIQACCTYVNNFLRSKPEKKSKEPQLL
jgi:hypothetical protein